jgi:hypothetical protein
LKTHRQYREVGSDVLHGSSRPGRNGLPITVIRGPPGALPFRKNPRGPLRKQNVQRPRCFGRRDRRAQKRRWAIELFFRWVKQTLKIRRFLGTSENAVRSQIAVALIAFLLLRLAQAAQQAINSPLVLARLIRANLMHRRRLDRLLETELPPISTLFNWRSNGTTAKPDSGGTSPGEGPFEPKLTANARTSCLSIFPGQVCACTGTTRLSVGRIF